MSFLFACFVFYSLAGFLIEVVYARLIRCRKLDRKCFLMAPLCPVYGFGAIAILSLPSWILAQPILLFLFGGLTATAVEYGTALFYEKAVGVKFWNYDALPGNLSGRVCLLYTVFWSVLSLLLVYGLHPSVELILSQLPLSYLQSLFVFLSFDGLLSLILLHSTGSTDVLKWYALRRPRLVAP